MPNITAYADNETYIGFLKLTEDEKKELRDVFIGHIQKYLKKVR